MIPSHHREFVAAHRLCVLSWNRSRPNGDGPPATPVFYTTDADDILISITEDRAKTKALRADPAITVCVLGEEMPFPYVTIFGTATIEAEAEAAAGTMAAVMERIGMSLDDDAMAKLRARAARENRVVLRVAGQRSVSNVPAPSAGEG